MRNIKYEVQCRNLNVECFLLGVECLNFNQADLVTDIRTTLSALLFCFGDIGYK